jgi:hypothetical protein
VTRSEAPSVLEEDQEGKTFGKLAAPIASRDIKKRWETSLRKLRAAAESQQ